MAGVDRQTLVELIEAEKAKLSPEALEAWEEFDTAMYLSSEESATFTPHERDLAERLTHLPTADQHVINRLTELRAGLYQSDYSERRGEPAQPHWDKCVIYAAMLKDRDEYRAGKSSAQIDPGRTVKLALARLREDG